jgi:hypothetical protein
MAAELPIACSLSETDLERRRAEIAALGRSELVAVRLEATRAALRFAAGARERVQAVAAAEAECCPFLTLRVAAEPGAVLLTIDAPPDAAGVLAELVATFR